MELRRAHGAEEKDFARLGCKERGKHVHDNDDESDNDRHKHNRLAACTEPNDDERSKRNFGEGVQNDDVWFEHFVQKIAPPKRERNDAARRDGNDKPDHCLKERHADMIEEGAFRIEGADRLENTRGGAGEKGISPAETGARFPKQD